MEESNRPHDNTSACPSPQVSSRTEDGSRRFALEEEPASPRQRNSSHHSEAHTPQRSDDIRSTTNAPGDPVSDLAQLASSSSSARERSDGSDGEGEGGSASTAVVPVRLRLSHRGMGRTVHMKSTDDSQHTRKLLAFYRDWTSVSTASDAVVAASLGNDVALYPLLAWAGTLMDRLEKGGLPANLTPHLVQKALSTARIYLTSDKFELDTGLHAMTWLCNCAMLQKEFDVVEVHLRGIQSMLTTGGRDLSRAPKHLQPIILHGNSFVAFHNLQKPIFAMPRPLVNIPFDNWCDNNLLKTRAQMVRDQFLEQDIDSRLCKAADEIFQCAQVLLYVGTDPDSARNVPLAFFRIFNVCEEILASGFDPGAEPENLDLQTTKLLFIFWGLGVAVPVSGLTNVMTSFPFFSQEIIHKFDKEEGRPISLSLRKWNDIIYGLNTGSITTEKELCQALVPLLQLLTRNRCSRIADFMEAYFNLHSIRPVLTVVSKIQGSTYVLREQLLGPMIARFPIIPAA